MNVLSEMEQQPGDPWLVRDLMLNKMGWCSKGVAWVDWQPTALARLFRSRARPRKRADGVKACSISTA